ncbi:MAG: hypothetical protein LBQ68_09820, partial [Clostridiales bacterium]|nr:hypothetical protein [Clostridiales bacterium]
MSYTSKTAYRSQGRYFFTRQNAARLAVSAMGFFIGRTILFEMINPVAIGFLSSLLGTGVSFYTTAVLLLLGIGTKLEGIYLIRYVICFGVLTIVNILVRQFLVRQKSLYFTGFAQSIIGAGCIMAGGLVAAWINDRSMYLVSIALMESALVFFLVFVLKRAALVLTGPKRKLTVNNEELISLAILFGCIIAGASDIYIGVVSLRYFLCFYFVLMAAYLSDAATAAAAG